jgi:hypothetical protein
MTHLAGGAERPEHELAVHNHAASDACADGEEEHVANAASESERQLAKRGDAHVVQQIHRAACGFGKQRTIRHIAPLAGKVRHEQCVAAVEVEQSGHPRADCSGPGTRFGRELAESVRDAADQNLGCVGVAGRNSAFGDQLAVGRADGACRVGAAKVDTGVDGWHRDEP